MSTIIRNIALNDNDVLLELGKSIFRETDEVPLLKIAIQQYIPSLSYCIHIENNIIGFILVCKKMTKIYYNFMNNIPKCYEISFCAVSSQYQGKGYGSKLLNMSLLSIFIESPLNICWLIVDTVNTSAIRLYNRHGFKYWIKTVKQTLFPCYIMGINYKRYKSMFNYHHRHHLESSS
jgi:ribosomal protein S18 acetylase RimI-like enzyme